MPKSTKKTTSKHSKKTKDTAKVTCKEKQNQLFPCAKPNPPPPPFSSPTPKELFREVAEGLGEHELTKRSQFVGRESQATIIDEALNTKGNQHREPSLVFCYGPPGTGKTTLTRMLCRESKLIPYVIDCSAFAQSSGQGGFESALIHIAASVSVHMADLRKGRASIAGASECSFPPTQVGVLDFIRSLSGFLDLGAGEYQSEKTSRSKVALIFDELEHLKTVQVTRAYSLADLLISCAISEPCINLIGISNDLTLIDTVPSSLLSKARRVNRIVEVSFPNYAIDEIIDIVRHRATDDTWNCLAQAGFGPSQVELTIRKCFRTNNGIIGDVRQVLRTMRQVLLHASGESTAEYRWQAALRSLRSHLGNKMRDFLDRMTQLPWQAQVALYATVRQFVKSNNQALSLKEAFEAYSRLSYRMQTPTIEEVEVQKMLDLLHQEGMLSFETILISVSSNVSSEAGKNRPFPDVRNISLMKDHSFRAKPRPLSGPSKRQIQQKRMRPSSCNASKIALSSPLRPRSSDSLLVRGVKPALTDEDLRYLIENHDGITQRLVDMATAMLPSN